MNFLNEIHTMGELKEHLQDISILDLGHFTITYTSKQDGNQYCIVFHLLTFEIDFFPSKWQKCYVLGYVIGHITYSPSRRRCC